MTREEIIAKWDGMAPRERDAWVAEAVFGWNTLGDGRMQSDDGFMIRAIPEYTSGVSEAWVVAEVFYSYVIERFDGVNHYFAATRDDDGAIVAHAYAESAPEAICLAAIIAKLTEEVA